MFANQLIGRAMDAVDCSPWGAATGRHLSYAMSSPPRLLRRVARAPRPTYARPLYTQEERHRRDESPWTVVQGVLAPIQFLVFLASLTLVLRFLATGHGEQEATISIVIKTFTLYAIMVTGSFWERAVFGRFLFAPALFWEDAVSMVVIALHTAYLAALLSGAVDTRHQMLLALAAYASYVVNATQFVLKLRAARREAAPWSRAADEMRHA